MRMQTKLSIVTVVGAGALLLCALAVIFTLRAQTVYAQDPPNVSISIGEATLPQGGTSYLIVGFHNMPKDPQNNRAYHPDLWYRLDLERNTDGMWGDANDCVSDQFGNNKGIDTWWRQELDIHVAGANGLAIGSDCPVGSYKIKLVAKLTSSDSDLDTDTREFTVIPGPSVEIDLSSTSIMRGGANRCHLEIFSSEQYSR